MKISRQSALLALTVALALMLTVAVWTTLAGGTTTTAELLRNGGFESGFSARSGCGMVGAEWGCFQNGGRAAFGFYDEGWGRAIAEGSHAQMIEINTRDQFGDQNRTAGIYQTLNVVKGQTYELTFKAMIRADDLAAGGDPWRYVMLVGFDHSGGQQWANAVWQEVNAGPIQDRLNPSGYHTVRVSVKAMGNKLTVFIAGRMKWGDWNREVDFNIDAVSLKGIAPATPAPTPTPTPTAAPAATTGSAPKTVTKLVCDGPNLLANGGFESGFDADGTGKSWSPFQNGGGAAFGFYDDTWPAVVAAGQHAQLLEINTYGRTLSDPDRIIGIYQGVRNLTKGATYEISFKSMIREAGDYSDEDRNRYEVHWGYEAGAKPAATAGDLDARHGAPVSGIFTRTAPGAYSSYSMTFKAPAADMMIYLLGLKKWATVEREVDFDFDEVALRKCRTVTTVEGGDSGGSQVCTYVVQRGDTLGAIAAKYHTTVSALAKMNGIKNVNRIYVMQALKVPCAAATTTTTTTTTSTTASSVHVVRRGEYLSQIAARYGVTVPALRRANNIKNVNLIYPGQKLVIPAH